MSSSSPECAKDSFKHPPARTAARFPAVAIPVGNFDAWGGVKTRIEDEKKLVA